MCSFLNATNRRMLSRTLDKDRQSALRKKRCIEIYRKLRPGDPPTLETATNLFRGMFFDRANMISAAVGRLNSTSSWPSIRRSITAHSIRRTLLRQSNILLKLPRTSAVVDDIDHLGNRRVRAVGELLENQFRIGLVRMERAIKEKMSVYRRCRRRCRTTW